MFDRTEAKTSAEIEYTPTLIHSELVSSYPSIAALHLPDVLHNIIPFSLPFLQDFLLNIKCCRRQYYHYCLSLRDSYCFLYQHRITMFQVKKACMDREKYGRVPCFCQSSPSSYYYQIYSLLCQTFLAIFLSASIVDMLAKTRSKNTTLGVEINPTRITIQNG